MEATINQVWTEYQIDIKKIINSIKFGYQMSENFNLIAQNIFYEKFQKYYENPKQYLTFFYTCLLNHARNEANKRTKNKRNITTLINDDKEVDVYDVIPDRLSEKQIYEYIYFNEIKEYLQNNLDEVEYFVFEQLLEGWRLTDITEMLECDYQDIRKIYKKIKDLVNKLN